MGLILAIDIGTTNCKAITFTTSGQTVVTYKKGYTTYTGDDGKNEQNPDEIFDVVSQLIQQSTTANKDIQAVSFSAAMHSLIPVNKEGKPLNNAMIWADTRSRKQAQTLRDSNIGKTIYAKTGTPIHPMSPLCKILWLKENRRDIFGTAFKFISIKEYIFFKLFGKYIVDYSIASATGLFALQNVTWCPEALEESGIQEHQLSQPVEVTHTETNLLAEYKSIWRSNQPSCFVIGGNDGCLANLGSGVIAPQDAVLTIGTSGAIRMTAKELRADDEQRLFTYLLTKDIFITGGAINNGGNVAEWLSRVLMDDTTPKDPDELLTLAQTAPPGAGNLLFLPYLLGERAPMWDANAKGILFGLTQQHTKAHIARAAIEGVCFAMRSVIKAIEDVNGTINTIYASGGFTQSTFWLQTITDICGKEIKISNSSDASSIGAAIIGMYALGIIKNLSDVSTFFSEQQSFHPNEENRNRYDTLFSIFQLIYPKLKPELAIISQL